jgi:hypothetical protein
MAKRLSQIDRAIADVDAKIVSAQAEHENQIERFKHGLQVLRDCRFVLIAERAAILRDRVKHWLETGE